MWWAISTSVRGERFHPLDPVRIQDSRPDSRWVPTTCRGRQGTPKATSRCRGGEVPNGAVGVLLNVTVTQTTQSSNLRI